MVAGGVEWVWEAGENALALVQYRGRLSMHEAARADDFAPENVADALVPQTHAKQREPGAEGADHLVGDARFFGGAGAGRHADALRFESLDFGDRHLVVAFDKELRPQLAEVLDEVVGERIVVVYHQKHKSVMSGVEGCGGACPGDCGHHAHCFVDAFLVLSFGRGIGHDAGAGLNVGVPVLEDNGAQGDAGVGVAIEAEVTDSAGVDAAFVFFKLVEELHGTDFGRAADGARGEGGAHDVEGGFVGTQFAGDVGDDVHDVAVAFDRHEVGDFDGAELRDAADIVAGEVDEHEVFGALFGVGE